MTASACYFQKNRVQTAPVNKSISGSQPVRRILPLAAMPFILLFAGGCFIPYTYPTPDYTPAVKLEAPPGEIHAFTVDISRVIIDVDPGRGFETLSEIPTTNRDEIPTQIKPSVSYGFVLIGISLNYQVHSREGTAVRLYCPATN